MTAGIDPFTGLAHMLSHAYMQRAFVAGSLVALACGLSGYPLVLRTQVFSGDALSHVAFTGAMFALAVGIDLRVGLFAGCTVVALAMAVLGRRGLADDAVIGSIFAWILGLGSLFLTLYTTHRSAHGGGVTGVTALFGSIFGMTASQAWVAALVAAGVSAVLLAISRPLLFASVDPEVAVSRGVPVAALGFGFLILVGVTAGEATQTVGALLILGLIAAPGGTAQYLSNRPFPAMFLSGGLAVLSIWIGLSIAYAAPAVPPSFTIIAASTIVFFASMGASRVRNRSSRPAGSVDDVAAGAVRGPRSLGVR